MVAHSPSRLQNVLVSRLVLSLRQANSSTDKASINMPTLSSLHFSVDNVLGNIGEPLSQLEDEEDSDDQSNAARAEKCLDGENLEGRVSKLCFFIYLVRQELMRILARAPSVRERASLKRLYTDNLSLSICPGIKCTIS